MPPRKKSENLAKKSANIGKNENKNLTETFKPVKKTKAKANKKKLEVESIEQSIKSKSDKLTIDISAFQEILKEFDLNCDYGPIIGIPRTARYNRAKNFNLPIKGEITQILTNLELLQEYPDLDLNIWHNIESLL